MTNSNGKAHVKQALTPINTDKARAAKRDNLLTELDPFKRLWGRNDTEALALRGCEFALIVMVSRERFPCKILEWGLYFAYVELQDNGRKCLLAKQAMAEVYPCANEEDLVDDEIAEAGHDA